MWYRESFSNCLYSTTVWASSWNACSPAVSRRVLPMTTSAGSSTARHVSRPRYAENASTIGARQTAYSRPRTAVVALLRTSTVPRGICRRRPMLMARKNTACRTRWVTSSMPPNASCASTSKGVRSSSRASGVSSTTRMDSLPRSTKAQASGGTASVNAGGMSDTVLKSGAYTLFRTLIR